MPGYSAAAVLRYAAAGANCPSPPHTPSASLYMVVRFCQTTPSAALTRQAYVVKHNARAG